MSLYAIGITPLLSAIMPSEPGDTLKHVVFADDITGAGKLENLKKWWDAIIENGKFIGYSVNVTKSWLIVKEQHLQDATATFANTGIQVTTEGRRQLGAVIGSVSFKDKYVNTLIDQWICQVNRLSEIAKIEPHAAYTAFTHGLKHRYTYAMSTIPNINDHLKRLDSAIDDFTRIVLRGYQFNENERALFSLPVKLGGLGIIIPSKISNDQYENSRLITKELTKEVKNQQQISEIDQLKTRRLKQQIKNQKQIRNKKLFEYFRSTQSKEEQKRLDASIEVGASSWLSALPIKDQGFYLDKQTFWDALFIRYGIQLPRLPPKCVCGIQFTTEHALSCPKGGFISMRHNEVRDLTAELLHEVWYDVEILQRNCCTKYATM